MSVPDVWIGISTDDRRKYGWRNVILLLGFSLLPSVADEGGGDAGEGEEVFGLAFVTAAQTTTARADGRYASYKGFETLAVVGAGGGDADGDGQTCPFCNEVDL